jgi:hypothetical protein
MCIVAVVAESTTAVTGGVVGKHGCGAQHELRAANNSTSQTCTISTNLQHQHTTPLSY